MPDPKALYIFVVLVVGVEKQYSTNGRGSVGVVL